MVPACRHASRRRSRSYAGSPAAARRRGHQGAGGDAGLRSRTDRHAAGVERVRRQDHHVPTSRRGGDGSSGRGVSRPETALDGAARIYRAATSPGTGSPRCATIWPGAIRFCRCRWRRRLRHCAPRHAMPGLTRRRGLPRRSRHEFRRRSDRARGRLADRHGMGPHGRGYFVAAQQAGAALHPGTGHGPGTAPGPNSVFLRKNLLNPGG